MEGDRVREGANDPIALSDVAEIRAVLIAAARNGQPLGYADLLGRLGYRFSRPKMRALCRTLDAIDADARAAGEPELAVLVVRETDGLPGQGWWSSDQARARGYDGPWTGREALRFVRLLQGSAYAYWREPADAPGADGSRFDPGSEAQM